jgi:hypothetical protein
MSDRTLALTVALDQVYRVDDAKSIMDAIQMLVAISLLNLL